MNTISSPRFFLNKIAKTILLILLVQVGLVSKSQATNLLPTVHVYTKDHATSYVFPATIELNAIAGDPDGTVVKVDYFLCGSKMVTLTKAPYEIGIKDLAPGSYTIVAKATDNSGGVSESCCSFTITAPDTCNGLVASFEYSDFCQNLNMTFWSTTNGDPYPNTFEWKIDGTTVSTSSSVNYTFASTGAYTVQLKTGFNGLCASVSKTLALSETAGPITGPSQVCRGQEYVFSIAPTAGATYDWWFNSDAYVVSGQGTATVTVHIGDYFNSSDLTVGVQSATCYKKSKIALTQNCGSKIVTKVAQPTAKQKFSDKESGEKILFVKVYTPDGQEVLFLKEGTSEALLAGTSLSAGSYIFHIVTENGTYIKPVVKF